MRAPAMTNFCDQCGTKLNPGARFCSGCGSATGDDRAASDLVTGTVDPMPPAVVAAVVAAPTPQAVISAAAPAHTVNTVVLAPTKSMGVAILLTILFGPLGLFYSSVMGGVVMLIVSGLVALVTLGFGLFVTWPICVIWAAVAANSHNNQLLASANAPH